LITKKETENTLRQSIETAFNDALAASKSYSASLKQVNAREEAFRMTDGSGAVVVSGEDGVRSLAVSLAVLESLRTGARAEVNPGHLAP
jgi:hypothetical protein